MEGRFDLTLEPKEIGLPGIVMEFKTAACSEKRIDLAKQADAALAQIDDRNYVQEMKDRGIQTFKISSNTALLFPERESGSSRLGTEF